jgi:hypothetical protein
MSRLLKTCPAVALAVAALLASQPAAHAAFATGSVGIAFVNPTPVPTSTSLATADGISFPLGTDFVVGANRFGDFTVLNEFSTGTVTPPFLQFSSSADNSTLTQVTTFQFDQNGATFVATGGRIAGRIFDPSTGNNSLTIFLTGTINGLNGTSSTPANATLTFDQTGTAVSGSGTIAAAPPVATPVPATALLAGLGGAFIVGTQRLRRRFV